MFRKFSMFAAVLGLFWSMSAMAQLKYTEGRDYMKLPEVVEVTEGPKITEFFWFGCPHCNDARPYIKAWLAEGKPENVTFEYIAVPLDSPLWFLPAQAYFTMKALNVDLMDAYFDGIHKDRNRALMGNEEAIKSFFVSHGVSAEDFDKTWNSFGVQKDLKQAKTLFDKTGLDGVPAFLVNGQYLVPIGQDKERALAVATYLAEK